MATTKPLDARRPQANAPLWGRLGAGDRSARGELAVCYSRLVGYVMRPLASKFGWAMEHDDMLQYGYLGLLQAIDRFDPVYGDGSNCGIRFETYALLRIRGSIVDAVRASSFLSRHVARQVARLHAAEDLLTQRHGRTPSAAETTAELGISPRQFHRDQAAAAHQVVPLGDYDVAQPGDDASDASDMHAQLAEAMAELPERSRSVLDQIYGQGLQTQHIAPGLSLTASRVSQIHRRALVQLRRRLAVTE